MKHLSIRFSCLMLLVMTLISSCSKDPVREPAPVPRPVPPFPQVVKELRVTLNESFLPGAKVDSAVATWEVNGTRQSVKLQAENGVLKTSLARFTNGGTGALTVQLFTQVKLDGQPLQWEHRAPYTLDHSKPVTLAAPTSIADREWSPRVIFHYDNALGSRFSAIIGIRPNDPYFELKGVEPVYARRIEIKRSFHDKATGQLVFSRGWVCEQASCLNQTTWSMVDRYHFLNLEEQLEGRQWDQFRIEAYFHLNSTPASAIGFALVQDKLQ